MEKRSQEGSQQHGSRPHGGEESFGEGIKKGVQSFAEVKSALRQWPASERKRQ